MDLERNIETICSAIQQHKPVEFEYIQEEEPIGKRTGNPHAIFRDTNKKGVERVYVHILQTGGVSKTIDGAFPKWRLFLVDKISSVKTLDNAPSFSVDDGYNPFYVLYSRAICKI